MTRNSVTDRLLFDPTDPASAGATPSPSPTGNGNPSPTKKLTEPVKLVVDGKEELVDDVAELQRLAQLGKSSTQRYQEAEKRRKEAEDAFKVKELVGRLHTKWTEADYRELGKMYGMTDEQLDAELAEEGTAAATPAKGTPPPPKGAEADDAEIPFSKLPKEARQFIIEQKKAQLEKQVETALASDEKIGYHMKLSEARKKKVLDLAFRTIRERARATGREFGDGTWIMPEVVKVVQDVLAEFTIPSKGPTSHFGLGPSGADPQAGLYPTKKPDRVSATHPDYGKYFAKVLGHEVATKLGTDE